MDRPYLKIGAALIASGLLAEIAVTPAFPTLLPSVSRKGLVTPALTLNGWVANFNPGMALRALKNDSKHVNELSLFSVGSTYDGRLAPETDFIDAALQITQKMEHPPRVLLTVANIRPHLMHDHFLIDLWLGSQERWMRHSQDLLTLSQPVDGLDLDYESLEPRDAVQFERFIAFLGNAMHQRGKFLSITVEHSTFMSPAFHWERISPYVDRVRVMAYHYHYDRTGPGAISPPAIVARLAARALTKVPANKLEIALPLYGFDWNGQGRAQIVPTLEKYRAIGHKKSAQVFRDPRTFSARTNYYATEIVNGRKQRVRHRVWFEDPKSAIYKIRMLQQIGIQHIGFWQLGAGNVSELFEMIKRPAS